MFSLKEERGCRRWHSGFSSCQKEDRMIGIRAANLSEADKQSFPGDNKRSPAKPPPEPERKSPPIGPPKRDPKPEPIDDPPMPPSPGNDPNDQPLPIGDPPNTSDPPIRMRGTAAGFPVEWPMNYSGNRGGMVFINTPDPTICAPL